MKQFTHAWQWGYTELLYLRARFYDLNGRFLTRDTWRVDYQMPTSQNAWLYVYANPTNRTDPTGFTPVECQNYHGVEFCKGSPNVIGYSEKTPPSGIDFDPTIDPLRRGAIGIAQNYPAAQFIKGWDHKNDLNYGLCGQTSIAAILNSYGHSVSIRALLDRYYDQALAGNIPGSEAHSFPGDDTLNYTGAKELANFINLNMGPGHGVATNLARYVPYPDQWEAQWEYQGRNYGTRLYNLIKGWVSTRQYPIASVTINGSSSGKVGSGTGGHWVVITGISREFSTIQARSPQNWLRIFNPFDNATEYYWFPDFFSNWIGTGQGNQAMVLMKPGPYYNIPFYDNECGRKGRNSPLFPR